VPHFATEESLVHVAIRAEELFQIGPFIVTNSMVGILITSAILLAAAIWVSRNAATVPNRMQSVLEFPVEFMANIVRDQGGDRWRAIVPLILTIFLTVLIANWVGLLPGVGTINILWTGADGSTAAHPLIRPASADLNFTLGLAIIAFVAFISWGLRANGVRGYLRETFVATPAYMTPIMTPIHIVSELSRLISLSMRLFGNVFAGEVLLAVMLALTFLVIPTIFLGLELVFGFVQALVFALLTMTYITLAMAGHGSHDEEHEDHPDLTDEEAGHAHAPGGALDART
jgi:F-type H+-transporting ATPase subunit a